MLFTKSGLRPGQTMLVQGASGGVSTALVQLGRAAGFRVWVTGHSEAKRVRFVSEAGIVPQIGLELPMAEAEKAFRAVLDGDAAGKIVLKVE